MQKYNYLLSKEEMEYWEEMTCNIYEEDEILDDDVSLIPSTCEITYLDTINASDTSTFNTTYTLGNELILPTLEKEGFSFNEDSVV